MTTDMVDYETGSGLRWQTSALLALQEATEAYLVHLFEDAYVSSAIVRLSSRLTQPLETSVQFMRNGLPLCNETFNLREEYEGNGVDWHKISPSSFRALFVFTSFTVDVSFDVLAFHALTLLYLF